MKICLNYYGQPRNLDLTKKMYDAFINDGTNEFHVLWTTWEEIDVSRFKTFFPNAFIKHTVQPNLEDWRDIINNYSMDLTNRHKSIEHYILGLYIKNISKYTIEEYENSNNVKFDFIISMRTDIYLSDNCLSAFYEQIYNNLDNTVYIAAGPKSDIYRQGADPDVIYIASKTTMEKVLSQLDIIKYCSIMGRNLFHPETSFHKSLVHQKLKIINLDFRAFPQPLNTAIVNWSKYDGLDSMHGDLGFVGQKPVDELKQLCLNNPECIGFNTLGFLKKAIVNIDQLQPSNYYKDNDALYIHQERYELFMQRQLAIEMDTVARGYGLDKCLGYLHDYIPIYAQHLGSKVNHIKNMLEIGIGCTEQGQMVHMIPNAYRTGNSLRFFRDLFENATIHGIDIYSEALFNEDRIKTYICDQSDGNMLTALARDIGQPFDVIVDDGSHLLAHQITSFETLEPFLSDNGVYIIEDILDMDRFMTFAFWDQEYQNYLRATYDIQFYHPINSAGLKDNLAVFSKKSKVSSTDINIFYHITCLNNYRDIVERQINLIRNSGLYDVINKLYCSVITLTQDSQETAKIIEWLQGFGEKIEVINTQYQGLEGDTLLLIDQFINNNSKFLYLHTKGVTRYNTTRFMEREVTYLYDNIMDWCNLMEYYLITGYHHCLNLLDNYDCVGVNYVSNPPHFSGSFIWLRGNHHLSVPIEFKKCAETWLFRGAVKPNFKCLFSSSNSGYFHYFNPFPMYKYMKPYDVISEYFDVFYGLDQCGFDLFKFQGSINEMIGVAISETRYAGFNSLGYFKSKVDLELLKPSPYFKTGDALFVKKGGSKPP